MVLSDTRDSHHPVLIKKLISAIFNIITNTFLYNTDCRKMICTGVRTFFEHVSTLSSCFKVRTVTSRIIALA